MKKNQFIIALILALMQTGMRAQETTKIKSDKFFELGTSLNIINMHNPRYTVVPYSGANFGANAGLLIEKPTTRQHVYAIFSKGKLHSENELNTTKRLHAKVGYSYQKRIKKFSETCNWYLGGDFSVFFNLFTNEALINSAFFYDFAQDLRLSTSIVKELTWRNHSLYLDYQLKIPIWAYISRPPKGILKDDVTEDALPTSDALINNVYSNGSGVWVGQYNTLNSNVTVWMPFKKNKNNLGLSYIWDLYSIHDHWNKKQVIGAHSIKITLLTNL